MRPDVGNVVDRAALSGDPTKAERATSPGDDAAHVPSFTGRLAGGGG